MNLEYKGGNTEKQNMHKKSDCAFANNGEYSGPVTNAPGTKIGEKERERETRPS